MAKCIWFIQCITNGKPINKLCHFDYFWWNVYKWNRHIHKHMKRMENIASSKLANNWIWYIFSTLPTKQQILNGDKWISFLQSLEMLHMLNWRIISWITNSFHTCISPKLLYTSILGKDVNKFPNIPQIKKMQNIFGCLFVQY